MLYLRILSVILLLLEVLQITFILLLNSTILHLVMYIGVQYSMGLGLVAALIMLPTILRLLLTDTYADRKIIYGYTFSYSSFALAIAATIQAFIVIFDLVTLAHEKNIASDLSLQLYAYNSKIDTKILIDFLQLTLQCCGSNKYTDWFAISWKNPEENSLMEFILELDVMTPGHNSSVPFSCCRIDNLTPCANNDLSSDVDTINPKGCAPVLKNIVHLFTILELLFYLLNIATELLLVYFLTAESSNKRTTFKDASKANILRPVNVNSAIVSTVAILSPSSHEELTLSEYENTRKSDNIFT